MSATCPPEAELIGFLERNITRERRAEIEAHFDTCAQCRELAYVLATQGGEGDGSPLDVGEQISHFVIEDRIAAGGMGAIYRAHDTTLRRDVALKLLHVSSRAQPDAPMRMLREAQGLARLHHPNVVTVYETGLHADEVFIAMELIDGVSLDRWLAEKPRPWRQLVAIFTQAARGLAAAHRGGLVHRDIKPANIMIASDRYAKIVDFGLARAIGERVPRDAVMDVTTRLTAPGTLVGTPAYCAPEQLAGYEVDTASDVFSFCVTLCEAVFGSRPYVADTAAQLLARMGDPRGPDLPRSPRIPAKLRSLLRRGLAFDPRQRPTMDDLVAALAHRPRARLVVAAAAVVVAIPIVTLAASARDDVCAGSRTELATIWNSTQRTRIRSAILGTRLAFAPTTLQHVELGLDGYANRWVAIHGEACRATAVHHSQTPELLDRRMACLASRRADLNAAVTMLAQTDRDTIREALRIVGSMPSLSACNDTANLLALAPPPPGVSLGPVREALARASALRAAGKYVPALAASETAVSLAERAMYKPLLAEALYERGSVQVKLLHRREGRDSYERALLEATASGDTRLEAQLLAELALVTHDESPDGGVAIMYARQALALFARIGNDPLLEAKLRYAMSRSVFLTDQGEGERQHALGLEKLRQAEKLDPDAARLLRIDYELMQARIINDPKIVLPKLAALLADSEAAFGVAHPTNALLLSEMAEYADMAGRPDEARGYARRVAVLLAPYPGADVLLRSLDASLEPDAAKRRPLQEAIVRDAERDYGATSPQLAKVLEELSETTAELGQLKQALALVDRALAIWEAAYGTRYQLLTQGLAIKAQIHRQLGDLETAIAAAERAVELAERNKVHPAITLLAKLMLSELYFRAGRYAAALPLFADIRKNVHLIPTYGETEQLELEFVESACHWKLEGDRAALRRLEEAHRKYRVHPQADPESVRDQVQWLAKMRRQ